MIPLALTLLLACGGFGNSEPVYTGTIEATEIDVAAVVAGRLVAVHVDEGDRLAAGDAVFAVDTTFFEVERDLRASGVDMADAAIAAAEAQSRAVRSQVQFLEREAARVHRLEAAGVGTAQQSSTLDGQLQVARDQLSAARQLIDQAHAARGQAEAGLRAAEEQLAEAEVVAPIDGVVLSRNREPGEVVAPGMSVVTLGDLDHMWLRIYVPLTTLETLEVNQPVTVRLDADPDQPYAAHIQRISPEAEFTPRDILTPDERVKRVFAVDVALEPARGLHPGIPAEAFFEVEG